MPDEYNHHLHTDRHYVQERASGFSAAQERATHKYKSGKLLFVFFTDNINNICQLFEHVESATGARPSVPQDVATWEFIQSLGGIAWGEPYCNGDPCDNRDSQSLTLAPHTTPAICVVAHAVSDGAFARHG